MIFVSPPPSACTVVYQHSIAPVSNNGSSPIKRVTTEQVACPVAVGPAMIDIRVTGGTERRVTVEAITQYLGVRVPITIREYVPAGQRWSANAYVGEIGWKPYRDLPRITVTS